VGVSIANQCVNDVLLQELFKTRWIGPAAEQPSDISQTWPTGVFVLSSNRSDRDSQGLASSFLMHPLDDPDFICFSIETLDYEHLAISKL
jgi:hypothetical protein